LPRHSCLLATAGLPRHSCLLATVGLPRHSCPLATAGLPRRSLRRRRVIPSEACSWPTRDLLFGRITCPLRRSPRRSLQRRRVALAKAGSPRRSPSEGGSSLTPAFRNCTHALVQRYLSAHAGRMALRLRPGLPVATQDAVAAACSGLVGELASARSSTRLRCPSLAVILKRRCPGRRPNSTWRWKKSRESFKRSSIPCLLLWQKQSARSCIGWPLRLPAPQLAEAHHDPAKARVLVFYPDPAQEPHKPPRKPFDSTLSLSDTYVRTPAGWRYVFGQASLPLLKTP
jgi:hypothetical protein